MSAEDISRIVEQETALGFQRFDEETAFAIGSAIRALALAGKLAIVVDIRTWDRQLFFAALPGSAGSNGNWVRRKLNVVKMFSRSTYRMVLEQAREDRLLAPAQGLSAEDYVLAGGGFPVRLANAGVIGGIAVSGLPERQDHELIVAALCDYLGLDGKALALPVEQARV